MLFFFLVPIWYDWLIGLVFADSILSCKHKLFKDFILILTLVEGSWPFGAGEREGS